MAESTARPRSELLRALAVLAEPPSQEHARLAVVLDLGGPVTAATYSDIFLFQLYPYASVHVGAEGMMGGEARARVAGFWRAVGQTPPTEPDHLAALLSLYASLADSWVNRCAESPAPEAVAVLLAESAAALLHEHIASWVFPFLARVEELAPDAYGAWARILGETLRDEMTRTANAGPGLPSHLAAAPALPDPREEGGADFLSALLAPVRTGVTLTRADLARIARDLGLGLRAGERRYALEHLMGQDAVGVLSALAAEARKRCVEHQARAAWLGDTCRFYVRRAQTTAELLEALAAEGSAHLAAVRGGEGGGVTAPTGS